jgi:hypothetical protein
MTPSQVAFTEDEAKTLSEGDFEDDEGKGLNFTKRWTVPAGCGCCSDPERLELSKFDDGTYHVTYWPAHGSSWFTDKPTLQEALDWF